MPASPGCLPQRPSYRKRVKTYNEPGHAHLWTFSCYQRRPLLTNDLWRSWLARNVDTAMEQHGFILVAFVFMPSHVHLIVYPLHAVYDLAVVKKAIKRPFSAQVKAHLASTGSPLLESLTVRERPGVVSFRFWQEGGGHGRNLYKADTLIKAIDYIHRNPVRKGLVVSPDRWPWSSWSFYENPNRKPDPALPVIHGLPPGW